MRRNIMATWGKVVPMENVNNNGERPPWATGKNDVNGNPVWRPCVTDTECSYAIRNPKNGQYEIPDDFGDGKYPELRHRRDGGPHPNTEPLDPGDED